MVRSENTPMPRHATISAFLRPKRSPIQPNSGVPKMVANSTALKA